MGSAFGRKANGGKAASPGLAPPRQRIPGPKPERNRAVALQVFIDGQYYAENEAKISVFDHTFLYGDGVFEGIRVYEGCIFRLAQHLDRLWDSAKYIMLTISMTKEEMTEAIAETVRKNEISNGYIRVVVSRGKGTLGSRPGAASSPRWSSSPTRSSFTPKRPTRTA
jgi:branched-subunit amino acid aminotransferase/4-amino-4-deoxychorismate lyase